MTTRYPPRPIYIVPVLLSYPFYYVKYVSALKSIYFNLSARSAFTLASTFSSYTTQPHNNSDTIAQNTTNEGVPRRRFFALPAVGHTNYANIFAPENSNRSGSSTDLHSFENTQKGRKLLLINEPYVNAKGALRISCAHFKRSLAF